MTQQKCLCLARLVDLFLLESEWHIQFSLSVHDKESGFSYITAFIKRSLFYFYRHFSRFGCTVYGLWQKIKKENTFIFETVWFTLNYFKTVNGFVLVVVRIFNCVVHSFEPITQSIRLVSKRKEPFMRDQNYKHARSSSKNRLV